MTRSIIPASKLLTFIWKVLCHFKSDEGLFWQVYLSCCNIRSMVFISVCKWATEMKLEELWLLNPSPYAAFIESHVNPQHIFLEMSQKCIEIDYLRSLWLLTFIDKYNYWIDNELLTNIEHYRLKLTLYRLAFQWSTCNSLNKAKEELQDQKIKENSNHF